MQNDIVTREQWLVARRQLLLKEKAHTQARQALAEQRRDLPWIKVEKLYEFEGPNGNLTLADLFGDRSQLAVYHLMFGADWEVPCVGCTAWAHALNGTTYQFEAADARLIAISRAPYAKLEDCAAKNDWTFPWVSSSNSDFNIDFYASSLETIGITSRTIEGTEELVEFDRGENHGVSVFAKNVAGEVFHTYSAYNRGIEELNSALGYFDLLPKGRG